MKQFLLLLLAGAVFGDYTGHRLLSIDATTPDQVHLLQSLEDNPMFEGLDFWTEPSLMRPTDVRVRPNDYATFQQIIQSAGIPYEVKEENIQSLIDVEAQSMKKSRAGTFCNIYEEYCRYEEIVVWLQDLASYYVDNMELRYLNQNSTEGRPIPYVKIASDLNNPKDAVWIEAGTHAREWISVSSALSLIDNLLYLSRTESKDMLGRFDWYIVPSHNPDGYMYSFDNERLWRKSMQTCGNSRFYRGTDLNRNWDSAWGVVGSSSLCSSDIYRGEGPFSAPETAALRDAVLSTPNVRAFFSIHAYSQFMLVPYGYTSTRPAKDAELRRVAEIMMAELAKVDGRVFLTGTPQDLLNYAASGGAYDYFYEQGIPYSYTYELRPQAGQGSAGFILPASEIRVAVQELFVSLLTFARIQDLDYWSEFS